MEKVCTTWRKYAPLMEKVCTTWRKYAPLMEKVCTKVEMILTLLAAVTTIAGSDQDIIGCFVSMLSENMECPIGSSYLLLEATRFHTMFGSVPVL
jgi:hypothetical protein